MAEAGFIAKALAEKAARDSASRSLAAYVPYVLEYQPAKHHRIICEALDRVVDGHLRGEKGKRLIIAAPPGSAKSTYTSLGFASYAAGKMPPGSNMIFASHTDEFSQTWGRRVRNVCQSEAHARVFPNGIVSADDRAASRWSTVSGTEYFGVGVGGSVTGRRGDILLCDDLLRGIKDADSKKVREDIKRWFLADAYTRLKPTGSVIIIATRWHEDDLTGELLRSMEEGTGEKYEYIKFQAICEEPDKDPIGRQYGEPLWPEWEPLEKLLQIRDLSGMPSREWASLYQQEPAAQDGNIIQRVWFNRISRSELEGILKECILVVSIDTAIKGHEKADPTVALLFARHPSGKIYLLKELRIRQEFYEMKRSVREFLMECIEEHGRIQGVLIENKGNGEALMSSLKKEISIPIISMEPKALGDKEFRFDRCTPVFEAGQFHVVGDPEDKKWVDPYIDELVTFPASRNDDRVDATSQALNWFTDRMSRPRRVRRMRGLA